MHRKALFLVAAAVASAFLLSGTARADRDHHRRSYRNFDRHHHYHHRHYARSYHLGHYHGHRGYSRYRSYRPYVGVSPYAYRAYRSHLYSPYFGRSYGRRYGYGGGGINVYGRRGGFYLHF